MRESPRSLWLSEHVHAFAWLAAAILVMALYISIHAALRCDYIKEIRPQVKKEVALYALGHHDVTRVLELRVHDEPYKFDPDDAGPLGIGNLPEARSVLAGAEAVIQRYNSALHGYIERLTAPFYPSEDSMNHMLVPEPALNPKAEANSAAGVSRVFRVTVESFANVRHSYPNEQTLDAIVDMVRGADLVELRAGEPPKVLARAKGTPAVKAAAKRISKRRHQLRRDIRGLFETPASKACPIPTDAKNCGCPKTERSGSAPEETQFHWDLRAVVEGNIGFFWVMGDFLWYEIMMLAVLGVVTHKLVVFAADYASGRRRDQRDASAPDGAGPLIWQPRESVRTLMQVVVAPIFSLVIIWILTLTNIISVKPLIGDTWSNGIVPIAFLLGLFPSLGHLVLRGLAEGVFGRRLVNETAPEAKPQHTLEVPDLPDDAAASFDRLRQRVRHHAMAVFER